MAERKTSKSTTKAEDAEADAKADVKPDAKNGNLDVQAAPLAAPKPPVDKQDDKPVAKRPNAVYQHAPVNDDSTTLTTEGGDLATMETCLEYPGPDDPSVMVRVTQRIYRTFTHRGSVTPVTQLLYPAGALISKFDALRLREEMAADAAAKAAQSGSQNETSGDSPSGEQGGGSAPAE